jgi:hypothetical protein
MTGAVAALGGAGKRRIRRSGNPVARDRRARVPEADDRDPPSHKPGCRPTGSDAAESPGDSVRRESCVRSGERDAPE